MFQVQRNRDGILGNDGEILMAEYPDVVVVRRWLDGG